MCMCLCVWMHTLGKELNLCIAYWEVNKYCLIQGKKKLPHSVLFCNMEAHVKTTARIGVGKLFMQTVR